MLKSGLGDKVELYQNPTSLTVNFVTKLNSDQRAKIKFQLIWFHDILRND